MAALGRWKCFLTSFNHIDAAIEAADPSLSRDEFRWMRVQIVEMLCGLEDVSKAEEFRAILDEVMAESLLTLQSVPEDAVPRILASTTGLANAVGALRSHESGRVCGLARDLICGWKAAVEVDIVRMTATIAQLDALSSSQLPSSHVSSDGGSDSSPSNPETKKDQSDDRPLMCPKKKKVACGPTNTTPAGGISRPITADKQAPPPVQPCRTTRTASESTAPSRVADERQNNKLPLHHHDEDKNHQVTKTQQENRPHTKKLSPAVVGGGPRHVKASSDVCPSRMRNVPSPAEKIEATKRKLHEGYREAADAKRQRRIQVIEAPKMLEQRQRKMHPIMRERSRARCGDSTAVRRSLISSFHRA